MRRGIRLKHIKTVTKSNGRRFVYYAAPGRGLIPLPDLPRDSAEFLAAYVAAQTSTPAQKIKAKTGTIAALIEAYIASDTFLALRGKAPATIAAASSTSCANHTGPPVPPICGA